MKAGTMQMETGTSLSSHRAHGVAMPRMRFHLDMASVRAEETAHRVWSEEGCLALVHWRAPMRFL